ncbi:hypothetical protein B0H10DRAFT_2208219 [Mycena sp. CBHHK59/15]|nr:hypothetical protein B0H10DRAFT_2208219 [Mycena sp. CBHHK59/15]
MTDGLGTNSQANPSGAATNPTGGSAAAGGNPTIPANPSGPSGPSAGIVAGPATGGPSGSSNGPGTNGPAAGPVFQSDVVKKLDAIVADFKANKLSRARAISLLVATLPTSTPGTVGTSDTALESYLNMLESHAAAVQRAADRGVNNGQGPATEGTVNSRSIPMSTGGDSGSGKKCRHRAVEYSDEESDGETGDQGRSSKKQILFEHELPWFADDLIAQVILDPKLQKPQELLRIYAKDFTATKRFIITSVTIPEFPDSKWDSIIRGRPTNLDIVFSSINALSLSYEHSEQVGAYEIRFGGTGAAAKKIQIHGDWTTAWSLASRAITFTFPHRARELRDYGDYIHRLFGAIAAGEAQQVICFDESV